MIKEQPEELEKAAASLEEGRAQAKHDAGALARPGKKEQRELIEQFDRVQLQNDSLSDTMHIAEHVKNATKLTTKA
jgi:hypothetical protein